MPIWEQFRPIPVDKEFCVLVEASKYDIICGRRRKPNCHVVLLPFNIYLFTDLLIVSSCMRVRAPERIYDEGSDGGVATIYNGSENDYFEPFQLANLVHSSFVPLPENMNHNTWLRFLNRMVDAKKTFQSEAHRTSERTFGIVFLYEFLIVAVPDFCGDTNETECAEKTPPLWWFICIFAVPVPLYFILKRIGNGPRTKFTNEQEKIVKEMQLAFNCSGYSAELVAVKVCGFENRYVRFTPISQIEIDRFKSLEKDFQEVYNAQKNEAKNRPYDQACWKPLEGQWEEKHRACIGKVTKRCLFNRTESADAFCSQFEVDIHILCMKIENPIPFLLISSEKYHLEGNLLVSDPYSLRYPEIFRLAGNYNSVAFYRCGPRAIWKVEGSTCMMFKFEGTLLSESDMISTCFWSTQEPFEVYHRVANADVETNLMVHGQFA